MNAVQKACSVVGGQACLARALGVTSAAVSQWIKGTRPVPARHCVSIERATNGQVTRRDLVPSGWQDIWPELVNIGVAAAPAAINNEVSNG